METTLKVVVDGIWRQGSHSLAVSLAAADGGELPGWQPGAHIDMQLASGLTRQYSLTGSPQQSGRYLVCVARDARSRGGSRYVHEQLRPGQTLTISAPRNLFALQESGRVLLLAAGIGITPLYAMAERLEAQGRPFELHYYVRNRHEVVFAEALTRAWRYGSCTLHVSAEGDSARKRLPAALRQPDGHLYLCGPVEFMMAVNTAAQAHGWPAECVRSEAFRPAEVAAGAASQQAFSVTLASSGQCWPVPAGQTIARVLLANGVDVPLSCEMGMCGACLTRVVSGDPDHQDSVQSAAEKCAPEQYIALCCSRSRSAELVIDL